MSAAAGRTFVARSGNGDSLPDVVLATLDQDALVGDEGLATLGGDGECQVGTGGRVDRCGAVSATVEVDSRCRLDVEAVDLGEVLRERSLRLATSHRLVIDHDDPSGVITVALLGFSRGELVGPL